MSTDRIKADIGEVLENWTDVPEFVDFRYQVKGDEIQVSEYDDAMPGQVQKRYVVELVVREVK